MTNVEEWIGGRFPAPALVAGGDVDYRPELSIWLDGRGLVLGTDLQAPGEGFAPTVNLLKQSMERPMAGAPRRPERVRVAEQDLADALRAEFGTQLEVVVGPTPELREPLESLREHLSGGADAVSGYLDGDGVTPERMPAFFEAAARLYRAAPWKLIRADDDLLEVNIDALGIKGHVVSIIGALGQNLGLVVFKSRADFEHFLCEVSHSQRTGAVPELPGHLSLNFESLADAPEAMRREAATHRWPTAGKKAFPVVMASRGPVPHDPLAKELAQLEALANAVADLASTDSEFSRAWDEGAGLERTATVDAWGQRVEVRLSAPARPRSHAPVAGTFDVHAEARDDDGILDDAWAEDFERELLRRFEGSTEATALAERPSWVNLVLHYGREQLDVMVGEIGAGELRDLLFEVMPSKVSCQPSAAPSCVAELRAFWTWAKRELRLATADECLAVLRPGAEKALERALSDSGSFGMAKSLFMAGQSAGYDVATEAGLKRYMDDLNSGKVPFPDMPALDGLPRPAAPSSDRTQEKKRKAKRKAQKKARKGKR